MSFVKSVAGKAGLTLIMGINEIAFARVPWDRATFWQPHAVPICRLVTNGVESACVSDVWWIQNISL